MHSDPNSIDLLAAARRLTAVAAAAALLLAAGCSDDGFGTRYPVTGTVTYQGEPVKEGRIAFTPVDGAGGRVANGFIENGAYSLTTFSERDGALPGNYRVAIVAESVDMSKAQEASKKYGGAYREDLVAKAKRTTLIPRKYNVPDTSGLTGEVKPQANTINFKPKLGD